MKSILHFLLLLIITHLLCITTNLSQGLRGNESDLEALLAIKAAISSDPHSALSSWSNNNSLHFCHWQGVTCGHRHQRVVSLDLASNNLVGELSPFVGNLSFLHELNLPFNLFRGNIPPQISLLSRLRLLALYKNYFEGEIPANLSRCLSLDTLDLAFNSLVGEIPKNLLILPGMARFSVQRNNLTGRLWDTGIGNLSSSMEILFLSDNNLEGSIPDDIGRFKGLSLLGLSENILSGKIPTSLYNLSNLHVLDLTLNSFYGQLPQDLGLRLPHISFLYLGGCSLSGQLPTSISNLSQLSSLDISDNSFVGKFSLYGNNLPHLTNIYANNLFSLGGESRNLNFVDTLTNCSKLTNLILDGNSFIGNLPPSILNLSTSLEYLDLDSNQLEGNVPPGLGKFVNVLGLWLNDNNFTGLIPDDIGKMKKIQGLFLSNNNFIGEIPSSLGNLTLLSSLDLGYNYLHGSLQESLGNCTALQEILVEHNNFSGSFPTNFLLTSNLITLRLGQNNFEGLLPLEISSLKSVDWLDISQNRFSGEIPNSLGECTSLTFLDMSQNFFIGSIPLALSSLESIKHLNLSSNKFSGQIPNYFSTWLYLSNLNLSYNNFSGEVPTNGIFANASFVSIVGNDHLCGGVPMLHLPKCPKAPKPKKRRLSSPALILITISCVTIVALLVASICCYLLYSSRKRKDPPSSPQNTGRFLEVSYQMLHKATEGFSISNLLGSGAFGSVYKGILHQNDDNTEMVVAVKVMNLQNDGAGKSFMAECKVLRNIRHRNLVKIITACSSMDAQRRDFKALVYEFIPKGSLENWLHSPNSISSTSTEHGSGSLSLFQRLRITIDISSALEYLHIGCSTPIIHRDLKPSNILLDDEMTARVGDFGLAKFVSGASTSSTGNGTSSTQVRGTVGYVAPEYGTGSKMSSEGDIYSLGIIILELMTSKRPTDTMFDNGLNLHDFAKCSIPNRIMEIIDRGMLGNDEVLCSRNANNIKTKECIKSIIMIGVQCSIELPQERMKIKDVVNELNSTLKNFQARI